MSLLSLSIRMVVMLTLCVLPVFAQGIDLRATIPFDFEVSSVLMPAGEYQVVRDTKDRAILVQSPDRKRQALALPSFEDSTLSGSPPVFRLVFVRYGDGLKSRSFLRSAWCGWHGIELLRSAAELQAETGIHIASGRSIKVIVAAKSTHYPAN